MQVVEEFGRTVDEAKEKAFKSLGVSSEEDLEIVILDPGRKATSSGFGAKFARIKVIHKGEVVAPARENDRDRERERDREPDRESETEREPVVERERERSRDLDDRPPARDRDDRPPARDRDDRPPARGRGRGRRPEPVQAAPDAAPEDDDDATPVFKSVGRTGAEADVAEAVLKDILRLMGVEAEVEKDYDRENAVRFNVVGEDLGALIGKYGQTIESMQYLVNLIASRQNDDYDKVSVDIEGYRERRERSLEELATRMARKVRQDGKSITLEPMLPSERRIIHMTLSEDAGVRTYSQGEEPMRKVIISPARRGGGSR